MPVKHTLQLVFQLPFHQEHSSSKALARPAAGVGGNDQACVIYQLRSAKGSPAKGLPASIPDSVTLWPDPFFE